MQPALSIAAGSSRSSAAVDDKLEVEVHMPNATRIVHRSRAVAREVLQLHPTGFEGYVADRFSSIPGWRGEATPRSRDQGADVIITSPRGVKYLVQCKLVSSSLGSPDAQRTGGAASFYGVPVENAILLSAVVGGTRATAFSAEARRYADTTGLKLWTLSELQVVADAEAAGNDGLLEPLGFDVTPYPVTVTPTPPVKRQWSTVPGWVTAIIAGLVLWLGVGVLRASAGLPIETGSVQAPLGDAPVDTDAVRAHLEAWGRAFPTVARVNDLVAATGFNAGAELEALRVAFEDRRTRGCWLEVIVDDFTVETVTVTSANQATATALDTSSVRRVCSSGTDSPARRRSVRVTYHLVLRADGWRIVDSASKSL